MQEDDKDSMEIAGLMSEISILINNIDKLIFKTNKKIILLFLKKKKQKYKYKYISSLIQQSGRSCF